MSILVIEDSRLLIDDVHFIFSTIQSLTDRMFSLPIIPSSIDEYCVNNKIDYSYHICNSEGPCRINTFPSFIPTIIHNVKYLAPQNIDKISKTIVVDVGTEKEKEKGEGKGKENGKEQEEKSSITIEENRIIFTTSDNNTREHIENIIKEAIIVAKNMICNIGYVYKNMLVKFIGNINSQSIAMYNISALEERELEKGREKGRERGEKHDDEDSQKKDIEEKEKGEEKRKKKYKIKLLCNWATSNRLYRDWKKMIPKNSNLEFCLDVNGSYEAFDYSSILPEGKREKEKLKEKGEEKGNNSNFNNCTSFEEPDYWIIINRPPENSHYIPDRTLVFMMEPYTVIDKDGRMNNENSYFTDWYRNKGLSEENFMYFCDHSKARNNLEWHLSHSIDELDNLIIEKSPLYEKDISTIVSSQYSMEGHKLRIDFCKYMEDNYKEGKLYVYGRDNKYCFKNYKGQLPWLEKEEGIFPYKYTFAAENTSYDNYITEKLIDCILGESLCFYWGSSNVEEYHDSRAFINLTPIIASKGFKGALELIEKYIENNEWEKRIKYIREEKRTIIHTQNLFSRIENIIKVRRGIFDIETHSSSIHITPDNIPIHYNNGENYQDLYLYDEYFYTLFLHKGCKFRKNFEDHIYYIMSIIKRDREGGKKWDIVIINGNLEDENSGGLYIRDERDEREYIKDKDKDTDKNKYKSSIFKNIGSDEMKISYILIGDKTDNDVEDNDEDINIGIYSRNLVF